MPSKGWTQKAFLTERLHQQFTPFAKNVTNNADDAILAA
jgi:hypothetical protein